MLFAVVDGFLMHAAMDVRSARPASWPIGLWQVVADRLLVRPRTPTRSLDLRQKSAVFRRSRVSYLVVSRRRIAKNA